MNSVYSNLLTRRGPEMNVSNTAKRRDSETRNTSSVWFQAKI